MDIPDFVHGTYDTSFIGKHGEGAATSGEPGDEHESENIAMIAAYKVDYLDEPGGERASALCGHRPIAVGVSSGLQKGVLRI